MDKTFNLRFNGMKDSEVIDCRDLSEEEIQNELINWVLDRVSYWIDEENSSTNYLHAIGQIADQLPEPVLRDVNQRVGDWLAMGGKDTDPYIEQQLRFAKRFVDPQEDGLV